MKSRLNEWTFVYSSLSILKNKQQKQAAFWIEKENINESVFDNHGWIDKDGDRWSEEKNKTKIGFQNLSFFFGVCFARFFFESSSSFWNKVCVCGLVSHGGNASVF